MDPRLRDFFDQRLERVLAGLPAWVLELFDVMPLVVEDHPAPEVLRSLGIEDRGALCGLYTGVPITERSVELPFRLPDQVTVYRQGILELADNGQGHLDEQELIRQIRITVLHELAHYHGLEEDQIADLGYG